MSLVALVGSCLWGLIGALVVGWYGLCGEEFRSRLSILSRPNHQSVVWLFFLLLFLLFFFFFSFIFFFFKQKTAYEM